MMAVGFAVLWTTMSGPSAEARAAECALLWAPAGKLDTPALSALLEKRPGLRLTLALAPEDAPDPKKLGEWSRRGRLELALRLAGDPILPVIAEYRGEDAVFRLAIGRQKHREAFGEPASGFFPGAGALSESLLPALAAQGLRWAASGDYRGLPEDPWAAKGPLVLVPARPLTAESVLAAGVRGVYVLDETGPLLAPGEGLKLLSSWPDSVLEACSATAAELSSAAARTDKFPRSLPTFAGDLSLWSSGEARKHAWSLYGQAVLALTAYQNSGNASLPMLDKATQALYDAQSSRFFREGGPEAEREGAQLRARLRKVYQTIGAPIPEDLRGAAVRDPSPPGKAVPSGTGEKEEDWGMVEGGLEGDMLWFSNPEDSAGFRPAGPSAPPGAQADQPSADLWTFRSMSASWNETEADFFFVMKALEASNSSRFGFDRLMVDLYIDVNHRPRQGSTDLLEGRGGFVPQSDAWEYALVLSPSQAWLLRFVPGQGPVVVDFPRVKSDIPKGELHVSVPRSKLRGNPAAWGYLPLALSPQAGTDRSAKTPPSPLLGEHGSPILGIIAPSQAQKRLGAAGAHRRFPFLRVQGRPPRTPAGVSGGNVR